MFYDFCKIICLFFLRIVRRLQVIGDPKLQKGQGFLVVSNHKSYWDPVVVGCILNRRINYMGKSELFKIPVLSAIIKNFGTFPIHRDGVHPSSIRHALDLFKNDQIVGIFPEGARNHTNELMDPHLGAAMLALKGGVPIVPIALSGTPGFWRRIKVNVGKPMTVTTSQRRKVSREEMLFVSQELMSELNRLLREIS